MDWVKLSTRYYLDPAMASLPDADAEVMFTRGLAYAGAEETSGFIPSGIVPTLCRRRRYEATADALVKAGKWKRVRGGYRIVGWSDDLLVTPLLLRRMKRTRQRIPDDVRRAVFERDQGRCARCGTTDNLQLDHIYPWSRGGPDIVENLQLLCQPCNGSKGDRI